MALTIAHHFQAPGERRETETMDEYMQRVNASMKLAGMIAQVNPEAADILLQHFMSR